MARGVWVDRCGDRGSTASCESEWESILVGTNKVAFSGYKMQVLEAEGPVVRRSARTAARSAISQAHLTRKYRLPTATEREVLSACW